MSYKRDIDPEIMDQEFSEYLDKEFGEINIGDNTFLASEILKEMNKCEWDRMRDEYFDSIELEGLLAKNEWKQSNYYEDFEY